MRQFGWGAVGLLLLMMALAVPHLDQDGLWYDEIWSLRNAGGAQYGPLSPVGIWEQVAFNDPHQALGYPYLLAAWGAFAGWSEFAGRWLSLLAAALAVALTFRLGRDLHSPRTGLYSAAILSVSAFFLYYTHELRAFTLVAFFSALLLWSYWRVLTADKPSRRVQAAFVLSAAGLLYTHYFAAATVLGALGVLHLFQRKGGRWLRLVLLALLVGVLFLPEVPAFLRGFSRFSPEDVGRTPLTVLEVPLSFAQYLGNGLLLLVAVLLLLGLWAAWRKQGHIALAVGLAALGVLLTMLANAALGILEPQRLRYTIVLWPLLALWLGAGLSVFAGWLLARMSNRVQGALVWSLAALWLLNGLWVNADPSFVDPLRGDDIVRWRSMTHIMQAQGSPQDVFAFYAGDGQQAYSVSFSFEHSMHDLGFPTIITSTLYEDAGTAWDIVDGALRLWYGVDQGQPENAYHEQFLTYLQEGWHWCRNALDTPQLRLDLYVHHETYCPDGGALVRYAQDDITLLRLSAPQREGDTLVLHALWEMAPGVPPETYSVALHLLGDEPLPVAQLDRPLPSGELSPQRFALGVGDVPPGRYSLALIVYEWRTGTRLVAFDATTNAIEGEQIRAGTVRLP